MSDEDASVAVASAAEAPRDTTNAPKPEARDVAPAAAPVDVLHPRGRILPPLSRRAPRKKRMVRAFVRLGQGLVLHGAFRLAPAMAFHFFLSLMPLLAFAGYVLGILARRNGVDAILGVLLENAPPSTEPLLRDEVGLLASATRLGPLAAFGFLWVASSGTHGLAEAVEWVVGARRRPWWKQRLFALAWVIALLGAVGLGSLGVLEWDELSRTSLSLEPVNASEPAASSGLDRGKSATLNAQAKRADPKRGASTRKPKRLLRSSTERRPTLALALVAVTAGLAAFYRFSVSHARSHKRRVFPGALMAVAVLVFVSWAFGLYLSSLASYTVYYGSLAAVAVLLVWLWLVSLAILVGAELNAQLEGLRDEA